MTPSFQGTPDGRGPRTASHLPVALLLALLGTTPTLVVAAEEPAPPSSTPAPPVASYRAAVSPRDLDSWIEHGLAAGSDSQIDRESALDQLILTRSLAEEARRLGLDLRPRVSIELAQSEGRLALAALRRHLEASILVTDNEVEAKYQQIKDTYTLPRRVRLRNLFKRFPRDASEADRAKLRAEMAVLRRRLLNGADFAALAETESDSRTRLRGGLIGNVRAGSLRPEVGRVAMALAAGEVSDVLEGSEGLTLLFCEAVLDAVHRSAAELRQTARKLLVKQAQRRSWAEMEEHLLETAAAEWRWQGIEPDLDGAAVLVRYLGGLLTVAETQALAAPLNGRLEALGRERARRRIEPFLRQRMAVRELTVRSLGSEARAKKVHWAQERILAVKALAEMVAERLEPLPDTDIETFFRAHPEYFERPAHFHLGLVSVPFEQADPRPGHDLAQRLLEDLESGQATFADLARKHSTDPSAAAGGDVGSVPRPSLSRRLGIEGLRAVLRLQPGERSHWVQDDDSSLFLLIELRHIEPARPLTFAEAEGRARQLLGQQRTAQLQEEITAEWWSRLEVQRRDGVAIVGADDDRETASTGTLPPVPGG